MNVATAQVEWKLPTSGAIIAIAIALGLAWNPLIAAAGAITLVALLISVAAADRLQQFWLTVACCLFGGFMFFDKSFAYIGYSPVYISELVLSLGLLALLLRGGLTVTLRSPVTWLWLALAADGVLRTAPYVSTYGIDALRDAMVWGYGVYAILIAAFLLNSGRFTAVPAQYARVLPWFLFCVPFLAGFATLFGSHLPLFPKSTTALLEYKAGDMSVHLAGAAAFLLLGLHEVGVSPQARLQVRQREWLWWIFWLGGVAIFAPTNRGGMTAILVAMAVVMILRPRSTRKWIKQGLVATVAFLLLAVTGFTLVLNPDSGRSLSAQQVVANVASLVGATAPGQDGALYDTRQWRLDWWKTIIGYTIEGKYFWTGKGYGVNLADADGFQVNADNSLRSPHSVHFSFLARAGVPGLALWLALLGTFWLGLFRAFLRAKARGEQWWARVNIWILAYSLAVVVNASFDVAIEGPQQGVVFWSLVGFGIAALLAQRKGVAAPC